MFQSIGNYFGNKPAQKGAPLFREPSSGPSISSAGRQNSKQTYSKVFRWRLPDGQTAEPKTVEIVGSFTHWQRVTLNRDGLIDAWHVNIHHIEGNKTHHYMLLIDGKPAQDKTCDGLVAPHGPQEERYQLMTSRGPRVFMLFAQTK